MIEGKLNPTSKGYWRDPGVITINSNSISFYNCKSSPFLILRNEQRNDSGWEGTDKAHREPREYRDITIVIKESKNCKDATGRVIQFLLPAHTPGEVNVLLYKNESLFSREGWDAWGVYEHK